MFCNDESQKTIGFPSYQWLYINNEFECFSLGYPKHGKNDMKRERAARVFHCFRVFGYSDKTRQTGCLHNIVLKHLEEQIQTEIQGKS